MTVRGAVSRLVLALASASFSGSALAHPGHGAPGWHTHGLLELLAFVGALAAAIWIARTKR